MKSGTQAPACMSSIGARTKIDHTRGNLQLNLNASKAHLQPPVPVLFIHLAHGITG